LCAEHSTRKTGCDFCPNLNSCQVRVACGLWVVCELPSRRDIANALKMGIQIDNPDKPLMKDVHLEGIPYERLYTKKDYDD
jgi:hypothetical protein